MQNLNMLPRGGTMCLAKAGVKIGNSGANDVDIAAPNGAGVDFAIKGLLYHKADAADIAITAATVQAVATTCLYVICLNASGTLSTVKGTEVLTASLTNGTDVLCWPDVGDDVCAIGAAKVVCDATHTFTAGTTNFSATGITDTFMDFMVYPAEPLTS